MKNQNHIVLQILTELSNAVGAPCKKKFQKIIYLIEEKNVDLGFDYKIYMYGPYSADLDYVICDLKTENAIDINYTKKGHILKCMQMEPLNESFSEIKGVIRFFGAKTASELELITTALYAYRHIEDKSDEGIIRAVSKIKGKKFSEEKIRGAIQVLRDMEYIAA